MLQTTFTKTSLLKKSITCSMAGITAAGTILLLGNGGNVPWLPPILVFTLSGLFLAAGMLYPFIWHRTEGNGRLKSERIYAALYAVIRYGIAFGSACFGWKKIFGLQFTVPVEIASLPMNSQDGEWLTWYYFGYSAAFGTIIAVTQIAGAVLLLFRRTLLFGSLILFAVMLNIMLINIFYGMNPGALIQSVILTAGLFFLILSDYRRIVKFLFQEEMHMPGNGAVVKNYWIPAIVLLSLLFTLYLKYRG